MRAPDNPEDRGAARLRDVDPLDTVGQERAGDLTNGLLVGHGDSPVQG